MELEFNATMGPDGSVTFEPEDDVDYSVLRERFIEMARRMADGNPVVEVDCVSPEERDAIAQRLAEMFLRECT